MDKKISTTLLFGLFALLLSVNLTSCISPENLNGNNKSSVSEEPMDLTQRLYKLNGVRVEGEGEDAVVKVRGGRADEIPRYMTPIFLLNGQTLEYSYQVIYQMMSDREIADVRVLRHARAAIYNSGNGQPVIEIISANGL